MRAQQFPYKYSALFNTLLLRGDIVFGGGAQLLCKRKRSISSFFRMLNLLLLFVKYPVAAFKLVTSLFQVTRQFRVAKCHRSHGRIYSF